MFSYAPIPAPVNWNKILNAVCLQLVYVFINGLHVFIEQFSSWKNKKVIVY